MSFHFSLEAIPTKEEVLRINRELRKQAKIDKRQCSLFIPTAEGKKILEKLSEELPEELTDLPF